MIVNSFELGLTNNTLSYCERTHVIASAPMLLQAPHVIARTPHVIASAPHVIASAAKQSIKITSRDCFVPRNDKKHTASFRRRYDEESHH